MIKRMINILVALALLVFSTSAHSTVTEEIPIGRIDKVTGRVTIEREDQVELTGS